MIKNICAGILTLFALVGGIWGARSMLATAGDLEKTKQEITEQSIQTFDKMQVYIDKRFALQELTELKNREDVLIEALEKSPNSTKKQKEYDKVARQIEVVEKELKTLKSK